MDERKNDDVALVVYNGLTTFEYAIPAEVLGLERPEVGELYRLRIVGAEPGPIVGAFGVEIRTPMGLEGLEGVGTIVVPGWRDRFQVPPAPLREALRKAHSSGSRLVSICSGAFVLAAAGALDGRRATTHWMYAQDLARAYPAVAVDADSLYVDDGSVMTSAGSAAGIDACLHLMREDWGASIADSVARRLVMSPHRSGGQAQHTVAALPTNRSAGSEMATLLSWLEGDLVGPHSLDSLARRVNQSTRSFRRNFAKATGTTPRRWITQRRIAKAQELLERTGHGIEWIASEVGFGSAAMLRHHFRQTLLTTPKAYRSAYSTRSTTIPR